MSRNLGTLLSWLLIALSLAALPMGGCAEDQATKAQINQIKSQSKVAVASYQAKAALNDEKGKDSPLTHVGAATTVAVKALRPPLIVISLVSFLALAVFIGLQFTSFSIVSKLGIPVAGSVWALSFFGLIALPFMPWILLAGALGVVALIIYEIVRAKSLAGGIAAFETQAKSVAAAVESSAAKI